MCYCVTEEALGGFWEGTRAVSASVGMEVVIEPAPEHSGREYTTSRVVLSSFEGRRIRAWYSLPKDRPRGRFAAIMTMPGYSGEKPIPLHLAVEGYAVLTLFPRGQGESKKEWKLDEGTY